MLTPSPILAITAPRRGGKDTLVSHLKAINPRVQRWAFADQLRIDLEGFIHDRFSMDVWTDSEGEKEILRPILIAYGCAQRAVDIDYWVRIVADDIDHVLKNDPTVIPVVSDMRFPSERDFFKARYGDRFRLIGLTREGAPPPTSEELKHCREMDRLSDMRVLWGFDTDQQQRERALRVARWAGISTDQPL